jgi:ribosome-binding protein aMBF1 (putative translation factor)
MPDFGLPRGAALETPVGPHRRPSEPASRGDRQVRRSGVHKGSRRYIREVKALGLRVRGLRNERGWTLEQAAERCDLDFKHLQKVESGQVNVTLVTLVRLAVGLKVSLGALFPEAPTEKRGA